MGQWKAVKPKAAAAYMQEAHSEPRPHDTGSARWL